MATTEPSRRTMLSGMAGMSGLAGLLALAGPAALTGCSAGSTRSATAGTGPISIGLARDEVALAAAPHLDQVVAGMRSFGPNLHRVSADLAHNWTASPLSIDVAFAMLRAGATGATAQELDAIFGYPSTGGSPHVDLNALTAELITTGPVGSAPAPTPSGEPGPKPIAAVANGVFVQRGAAAGIGKPFLRTLATKYGAEPIAVDFGSPSALRAIDAWVSQQTRKRITKLFDHLNPDVFLVLANAVYLKADWLYQFQASMTAPAPFTLATGSSVKTPTMRQMLHEVQYRATAAWQRVTLPYVGGELTMRVVLPAATATSVGALRGLLPIATEPKLSDAYVDVDLALPKWNTSTNIDLLASLQALGLTDGSDLGGITDDANLSDAIHRANITVDELGSEAAAVTGVTFATSASARSESMRVNRPYVWAVVHEPTGTPVFIGHVVDPTTG